MTVPPSRCASASASADLPLAVGPAISTARLDSACLAMNLVATLISNPAAPALDTGAIERARGALPAAQAPVWLDPGIAADIPFTGDAARPQADSARALADRGRDALGGAPIDVVVQQRVETRRKMLFLADMDSTMIGQECIDELADYVGLKEHVAAITERAMRGEIEFAPALRERVALLKGLPTSVVGEVISQRISLTPGARTLVATLRKNGAHTCLVSGGFTLFTGRIAAMIGFDENRANTLLLDGDGRLTGQVAEPVVGSEAKLAALIELRQQYRLAPEATLVTGDGANDIAMIEAAGFGVAYHAKPKVAEAAAARIDHGDLTALLHAQGYRRDEFVQADE
jgi:phosphoserine phosphatase